MPKIKSSPSKVGRVLLTRPLHKNHSLSKLLNAHGFETLSCPLIQVTSLQDKGLADKLNFSDIVIAVSANAISSAIGQVQQWPERDYIAVGKATAQAFSEQDINATSPNDPRTEGLLELPLLKQPVGKNVVILRGNGGRETLAQQLRSRGATVTYSELYRRDSIQQAKNVIEQWQHQGITTIVVTSAEILQILLEIVNNGYQAWLAEITVIVPSTRVAEIACQENVPNIRIANGADNQAILNELKNLQSSFYEK